MDMFGSAEHSSFPLNCLLTSGLQQKSKKAKNLTGLLSSFSEATGTCSFVSGRVRGWKPLWDGSHNGDVTQHKKWKWLISALAINACLGKHFQVQVPNVWKK